MLSSATFLRPVLQPRHVGSTSGRPSVVYKQKSAESQDNTLFIARGAHISTPSSASAITKPVKNKRHDFHDMKYANHILRTKGLHMLSISRAANLGTIISTVFTQKMFAHCGMICCEGGPCSRLCFQSGRIKFSQAEREPIAFASLPFRKHGPNRYPPTCACLISPVRQKVCVSVRIHACLCGCACTSMSMMGSVWVCVGVCRCGCAIFKLLQLSANIFRGGNGKYHWGCLQRSYQRYAVSAASSGNLQVFWRSGPTCNLSELDVLIEIRARMAIWHWGKQTMSKLYIYIYLLVKNCPAAKDDGAGFWPKSPQNTSFVQIPKMFDLVWFPKILYSFERCLNPTKIVVCGDV